MGRLTVHDSLNTLNVGLIRSVAASVRVGNVVSEHDRFAANFTLCHLTHLLGFFHSQIIIAHLLKKSNTFFQIPQKKNCISQFNIV